MHILSSETDNCPPWFSGREWLQKIFQGQSLRMLLTKWKGENDFRIYFGQSPRMLMTWLGLNWQTPDHQSDAHPTEPPRPDGGLKTFGRYSSIFIRVRDFDLINSFLLQYTSIQRGEWDKTILIVPSTWKRKRRTSKQHTSRISQKSQLIGHLQCWSSLFELLAIS